MPDLAYQGIRKGDNGRVNQHIAAFDIRVFAVLALDPARDGAQVRAGLLERSAVAKAPNAFAVVRSAAGGPFV